MIRRHLACPHPPRVRRWCKPLSLLMVLLTGSMGAYLCSEAATLTTPVQEPKWFPDDHMWTGLRDSVRSTYLSGDSDSYISANTYFGLASMHSPGYNRWTPDKNRGTVQFDAAFDLSEAAAQATFKRVCAELRTAPCDTAVCARPPGGLLASLGSVECFLEDFETYAGGHVTGSAFGPALRAWLATDAGRSHEHNVGLINGHVAFARIRFTYSALFGIPVQQQRILYDAHIEHLSRQTYPTSLGRPVVDSGRLFAWMVTSEKLVDVVFSGIAIIMPCAFLILLVSSGSFVSAALATLTVALITGSLLGGCKLAFGFALGIGEAIAGNIVIGLAVDYTLHLSHTYAESPDPTREGKTRYAATVMGVTVLAGASTTFVSSLFMLPCQLTFFTDMCTLIGGTVLFSLTYALLFFMPLMALVGPKRRGFHDLVDALRARCGRAPRQAAKGRSQAV